MVEVCSKCNGRGLITKSRVHGYVDVLCQCVQRRMAQQEACLQAATLLHERKPLGEELAQVDDAWYDTGAV